MTINIFNKLFSLEGKTAMITGGYKGIGRTFAETYAEAGADVVLVARNKEKCRIAAKEISNKFKVNSFGTSMDVVNSKQVDVTVKEIIEKFKKIDILVNCAGISGSEKKIVDMTDEEMDNVMNIDFRGVFVTSRSVGKHMAEQKYGKIINISSILGKIASRNMSGYCSSKAAVIQLTKVMALEMIRDNVQVNVLCPGYFITEFNNHFFKSEKGKKLIKKMIPLNRVGDLKELISTALYLATCPSYMTGTELYIDGGYTLT